MGGVVIVLRLFVESFENKLKTKIDLSVFELEQEPFRIDDCKLVPFIIKDSSESKSFQNNSEASQLKDELEAAPLGKYTKRQI